MQQVSLRMKRLSGLHISEDSFLFEWLREKDKEL